MFTSFSGFLEAYRQHRNIEGALWQAEYAYSAWRQHWPDMCPDWAASAAVDEFPPFWRFIDSVGYPSSKRSSHLLREDLTKPFGSGNAHWGRFGRGLKAADPRYQRAYSAYSRLVTIDGSARETWPVFDVFLKSVGWPPEAEKGCLYRLRKADKSLPWANNAAWISAARGTSLSPGYAKAYRVWARLVVEGDAIPPAWAAFRGFHAAMGEPPPGAGRVTLARRDPAKPHDETNSFWCAKDKVEGSAVRDTYQYWYTVRAQERFPASWAVFSRFLADVGPRPSVPAENGHGRELARLRKVNPQQPHGKGNSYWLLPGASAAPSAPVPAAPVVELCPCGKYAAIPGLGMKICPLCILEEGKRQGRERALMELGVLDESPTGADLPKPEVDSQTPNPLALSPGPR